ncbi:MAG: hypothetical protein ACEPOW_13790 [Bacteroidales bacterium]
MAVPDTETFTLQNVADEIGGGLISLQSCFDNANSGGFDPTYNQDSYAPANSMLRFRNYTHVIPANISLGNSTINFNFGTSPTSLSIDLDVSRNLDQSTTFYGEVVDFFGTPNEITFKSSVTTISSATLIFSLSTASARTVKVNIVLTDLSGNPVTYPEYIIIDTSDRIIEN